MKTNRDLYEHIAALAGRYAKPRPLEEYLRALAALVAPYATDSGISLHRLAQVLEQAFTAPAPAFDPSWASPAPEPEPKSYSAWLHTLRAQVVDLREMETAGTLGDEQRYFGLNSPRGSRWYNFDPCTYLECGVQGSVGGWQPDDATGRIKVPGKVAMLNPAGELVVVDPDDIEDPIVEISEVSWENFEQLLWAGQTYE